MAYILAVEDPVSLIEATHFIAQSYDLSHLLIPVKGWKVERAELSNQAVALCTVCYAAISRFYKYLSRARLGRSGQLHEADFSFSHIGQRAHLHQDSPLPSGKYFR